VQQHHGGQRSWGTAGQLQHGGQFDRQAGLLVAAQELLVRQGKRRDLGVIPDRFLRDSA
jgi:hypothetical protein